jgi:hypothetical protein
MKQSTRSYNLLCPISRALDHIGDRWTLLILRDLYAGPARFKDLQTGLAGIASNLLSDRLHALEASGFTVNGFHRLGSSVDQAPFASRAITSFVLDRPSNLAGHR